MNGRKRHIAAVMGTVVLAALLAVPGNAFAKGPGGGGKPGTETAVNNLSYPIEWAGGSTPLAMPGTEMVATIGGTVLSGTYSTLDLTTCLGAVQKDPLNVWQAQNDPVASVTLTEIDWGDNLEAKDWKAGSVVRVETGLYDNALATAMLKYEMCYISGSGTDEVWGLRVTQNADGTYTPVTTDSTSAMVYTSKAYLTIQKIDPDQAGSLTWDATNHLWVGASQPVVNEQATGELNVQGKVVYGYVWRTKSLSPGEYRITFSLGNALVSGVSVDNAYVAPGELNSAVVDATNNLTYIDVGLTSSSGGGRK